MEAILFSLILMSNSEYAVSNMLDAINAMRSNNKNINSNK